MSLAERARRALSRNRNRLSMRHNRLAIARRLMRNGDDFHELSRFYTELVQAPGGKFPFLVPSRDDVIAPVLFSGLDFDLDVMGAAVRALTTFTGADPIRHRHMIDVGANIGTTSVYAVKLFGAERITAIEPGPTNAKLARCNAILNDVADRVTVHQCAASNMDGSVELALSGSNPGGHRVIATGAERTGQGKPIAELVTVSAIRLDSLDIDAASVGLVWIDAEGHEGHVLDGAEGLLRAGPPLMLEYWPDGLVRAGGIKRFEEVLADHYRFFADAEDGFQPRPIRELPSLRSTYQEERELRGHGYTDLVVWRSR